MLMDGYLTIVFSLLNFVFTFPYSEPFCNEEHSMFGRQFITCSGKSERIGAYAGLVWLLPGQHPDRFLNVGSWKE